MYGNRDNRGGGDRGGSRFGGGGRSFGGGSRFGGRDSGPRKMFPATCAVCGDPCEVPFRPSGSRPVYCNKHFEGKEGGESRRPDSRSFDRPRYGDSRVPSAGRDNSQDSVKILGELKNLNMKMDRLLSSLESKGVKAKTPKPVAPKKVVTSEEKAVDQLVAEPPVSE